MGFVALAPAAPIYKARSRPGQEPWRPIRHAAERREAAMRKALAGAFADLRTSVDLARLESACETRRLQAVLDEIDLDAMKPGLVLAFGIVNDALVEGGQIAGQQLIAQLFPVRKVGNLYRADFEKKKGDGKAKYEIRFDLTNPEAVRWAGQNAGARITQITEDSRKGLQALVVRSFEQGIAPKPLAKLIREQGLGLTAPQANALANFRAGLLATNTSPERIAQLTQRRSEKMLRYRSHVIARQELLTASNQGQSILWGQTAQAGLIPETTKRKWIITPDDRLCPLCAQMTGERAVTGLKQSWSTPNGAVEIPQQIHVQCRCAQGLVIDLDAAQAQAALAVAEPSPALRQLMPKLVEPAGAALPPGMVTPKPAEPIVLSEGQLQTIWQLASSGKAKLPQIAAGMKLDLKIVADGYRLMAAKQAQVLAELQTRAWPIADNVPRTIGSAYPAEVKHAYASWNRGLDRTQRSYLQEYTGSGYQDMNRYLRAGGDINSGSEYAALGSKEIQNALMKAPKPPPPELVWRGVKSWPEQFADGSVQRFKGFQSTTISPKFAEGWSNTLLEIRPKRGAYIQPLSAHGSEMEYLLPHNAEFKVIGRRTVKFRDQYGNVYDRSVIQLEQVD